MVYLSGSFVSDGRSKTISLPAGTSHFVTTNYTNASATSGGFRQEFIKGTTPEGGMLLHSKGAANAVSVTTPTSNGFVYREKPFFQGPIVTGTAITNANPAVATSNNSFSNGDVVAIFNSLGMGQIAGMEFTVSSVSGTAFTLSGLDASSFANASTGFQARKVSEESSLLPGTNFVTKITRAAQAIVTTSKVHPYVINQIIHFSVPSSFGMSEINQLSGTIQSKTDYSFTVDVDSSGFTAFTFPLNANVPSTALFATVAPAGQKNGYNVDKVPFKSGNQSTPSITLSSGATGPAGQSDDVIVWESFSNTI